MGERVSSEHASVDTVRARVARHGGTRRPELSVPDERAELFPDDVVRLVIDGREYHAPIESGSIRGAYDNPRLARDRAGTNRLAAWLDDEGVDFGRSVVVDVVVPEFRYGVRLPGEEAVYDASPPPSGSLRDIAEGLDG